jgi:hypothetical protein
MRSKMLLSLMTALTLATLLFYSAPIVLAMENSKAVSSEQSSLGESQGAIELCGGKAGLSSGQN